LLHLLTLNLLTLNLLTLNLLTLNLLALNLLALNLLALDCSRLSSWPRRSFYSSWRRWCLSPLVLLGYGLHVCRGSRPFRLAGRRLGRLVLLFGFGRRWIRLFPVLTLRVRCCAYADHQ
jgi:hypothetical protein